MNVMTGQPLRNGLGLWPCGQVALQRWRRCIGCLSKLSGFDPIYLDETYFLFSERAVRNAKQLS